MVAPLPQAQAPLPLNFWIWGSNPIWTEEGSLHLFTSYCNTDVSETFALIKYHRVIIRAAMHILTIHFFVIRNLLLKLIQVRHPLSEVLGIRSILAIAFVCTWNTCIYCTWGWHPSLNNIHLLLIA